jgi:hypothetical protein
MKKVICDKCGQADLVWAKSKAGNFYLAEPDYVQFGERQHKVIPFAHKCPIATNYPKSFAEVKVAELQSLISTIEKTLTSIIDDDIKTGFVNLIAGYKEEIKTLQAGDSK